MPRDPALAASLLVLGLVACTAAPARLGPDADPRAARRLLEEAASAGPVRLELNRPPSTSDGAMTVSEIGYTANARVISTQDEMSGDLIDVVG